MQFGINQPLAKQNKEANPVILNSENKGNSYNIKTPWATNHFVVKKKIVNN